MKLHDFYGSGINHENIGIDQRPVRLNKNTIQGNKREYSCILTNVCL